MDWEREKRDYVLKENNNFSTFENNFLLELFEKKETHILNSLKYWRGELLHPLTKDFAQSQIYYFELELEALKSIQFKLTKLNLLKFENGKGNKKN